MNDKQGEGSGPSTEESSSVSSRLGLLFWTLKRPSVFFDKRLRQEYKEADEELCRTAAAGRPEKVSQEEYKRILADQNAGKLTIQIDTPGFRKFLFEEVDSGKLSAAVGRPLGLYIAIFRFIGWLDCFLWLISSILSMVAFGWKGIPLAVFCILLWMGHKFVVSGGRAVYNIIPEACVLIGAVSAAYVLSSWSLWARSFLVSVGLMFFIGKFLYLFTAVFVFKLIHSSYPFFQLFYLPSTLAAAPLIWTSELKGQLNSAAPKVIPCEKCQQKLRVRTLDAEVNVRCPSCRHEFRVRADSAQ